MFANQERLTYHTSMDIPNHSIEADLKNFEAVLLDPVFKKGFDLIDQYNQILADQSVTYKELVLLIQEIDAVWHELIGRPISFTGMASFTPESYTDVMQVEKNYYEQMDMIFGGVSVFKEDDSPRSYDDDTVLSQVKFQIKLQREGIHTESYEVLTMVGAADASDIISIENDYGMSYERAQAILEYYYPDLIDDIDAILLNSENLSESELVKKIASLEVDVNSINDGGKKEASLQAKSKIMLALDIYTQNIFDFDRESTHGAVVNGLIYVKNQDGKFEIFSVDSRLLLSSLCLVWEDAPDDDVHTLRPHVRGIIMHADRYEESDVALIPLTIIKDIASARSSFFTD